MFLRRLAFIGMLGALLSGVASAAPVSDEEITATLIGSWVNPPESARETPGVSARQVFRENGTTTLYVYGTPECRVPAASFEANWAVVDGLLITQVIASTHPSLVPVGTIDAISVVALAADHIVLDVDGQTYIREKSETCYGPDSHRT
jgi:hypothetical protein